MDAEYLATVKTRKEADTTDQFVEEIISNWTRRSQKEGLCGIVNCYNKTTTECKKCKNYYCKEHFKSHLDLVPGSMRNRKKE